MMWNAIATFGAAFGLSLTYSLLPGPVNMEALRRGARRGARAVVGMRLGALAGSLAWAVAGLTGAGVVVQNPQCRLLLSVVGTALLLLVTWRALRPTGATESAGAGARRSDALVGVSLALANPLGAAFWLGVGGSLLGSLSPGERFAQASAFVAGFICANLMLTAAYAAFVGVGRYVVGGRFMRAANLLFAVPLAWFALSPLIRAI